MPETKKPELNEIAGVERDIFTVPMGKIWPNPDKTLLTEGGSSGIGIYEDLLRDDKVGSTLQTRKLAVVGKEWEVVPASDKRADQKVSDFVRDVLKGFNYDAARKALLSGTVIGFKPGEVMWDYSEGDIWVKDIIGRSPRRFVFDTQGQMRMLTWGNMVEGEELPNRKFVTFRNISDNGSPYGDPLGSLLYWPVWFKKNAIKFWMIFADKFGSPTTIGKYPPGTQKTEQDKLLEALQAIQQESAIKIPNTMEIALLEAQRNGNVDTYQTLCDFMNSAIAQILLGQTLTSEVGDKGSYAASKTHEKVREDYIKADADMLCECQNSSLIKWIVDYNFPNIGRNGYPKVWIRCEEEKDLMPLAERDEILQRMGAKIPVKYINDTYGIPEAEEGEELLSPVSQSVIPANLPDRPESLPEEGLPTSGNDKKKKEFTESGLQPLLESQGQIDSLADNSLNGLNGLNDLYRLVDEAESYEDLQSRVAGMYKGINLEQMREIMARAMFMADLKGRAL